MPYPTIDASGSNVPGSSARMFDPAIAGSDHGAGLVYTAFDSDGFGPLSPSGTTDAGCVGTVVAPFGGTPRAGATDGPEAASSAVLGPGLAAFAMVRRQPV